MKNEIAILMAAGLGSRMAPLTNKTPKPLVKVFGKPMIETIIDAVNARGVKHIYVVVGYLKEQFTYLLYKYKNLTLIENKEYLTVNNISSIKAVTNILGKEDCFICEADLYISDKNILKGKFDHSCYFGKFVKGHSDDWVFDLDSSGRITRVGKYGDDQYNMCGLSFFKANDALILKDTINEAYNHPGEYENLFWDDVVNNNLDKLNLMVHEIKNTQITEIDSVSELSIIDPDYLKYN